MILLISPMSLISLCDGKTSMLICVTFLVLVTLPVTLSRMTYITGSLKFNKNLYGALPRVGDVYVMAKNTIFDDDNGFFWQVSKNSEIKVTLIPDDNKEYPTEYFFFCEINGVIRVIDFIKFRSRLIDKSDYRNSKLKKLGRKFGY
jgi:hypothetical protein